MALHCMECSLDGEHLASGSGDGSIRIWHTESFHATASKPHMERPTRTPKQADKIMLGSRVSNIMALSFSRTDSNILASGDRNGEIKVWNVKEQACIHAVNPRRDPMISLCFAGGADIACIALAGASVIRLWRAEGSSDFASETIGKADLGGLCLLGAAFSPSGSFVATSLFSSTGDVIASTLALYELETMTKTQSAVTPGFIATCFGLSPDSKQLAVGDCTGGIGLLQAGDLSTQRDLDARGEGSKMPVLSITFDPTCRVLAFGYQDGRLELRAL
jgi:WD40 repeat protein